MKRAFLLASAEQTFHFGRQLASILRAGDLIILSGQLGVGKTALTQGIGAGLGVRGEVTSPTFVIARVHPADAAKGGTLPLVHVDAYRLGSVREVDDLDLDTELAAAVTAVEWGEGLVEQLSDAYLEIELTIELTLGDSEPGSEPARKATLHPHDGDWTQRLALLTPVVGNCLH